MSIETVLARLAEEHLRTMAALGWTTYAASLLKGGHGETFGCTVDDVYFDVGDRFEWVGAVGGPIRLIASAYSADKSVERDVVLTEISN